MNNSKLVDIFKDRNIVIPIYLLKNFKNLKLKIEEFVLLMYFYNLGDSYLFNPSKFCEELNISLVELMSLVDSLTDKGFIKVEVKKNDKGIVEEVLLLDGFYSKVSLLMREDISKKQEDNINNSNIYETIEKEFGRTLSPIEAEIISAWLDNNTSEELIKEALKEAVFNGVSSLRYIDKILYEWGKKGIRTIKDVENNREKRNENKSKNDDNNIDFDTLEWNWFDEDE